MKPVKVVMWCCDEPLMKMVEIVSETVTAAMLMLGGCEKVMSMIGGL